MITVHQLITMLESRLEDGELEGGDEVAVANFPIDQNMIQEVDFLRFPGDKSVLLIVSKKEDSRYGTFAGKVDPTDPAKVAEVLGYAMDRVEDELLTPPQMNGMLLLAIDCIELMRKDEEREYRKQMEEGIS